MRYMLDTNICIYIINKRPQNVFKYFRTLPAGSIGVSSITEAELFYGVEKSSNPERNGEALSQFFLPLELAVFNSSASAIYGKVRADLERSGNLIGSMDLLIASHALSLDTILVTNNEKEFRRVKDLKIENLTKI